MKFKKFQSLAKSAGMCEVICIEEENIQFLNNGYTVYPVHRLPSLNDEMIIALLDIKEKKREDFSITHVATTSINYNDIDDSEEPLVTARFTIKFDEVENVVRPVFAKNGLYYYNPKWLEPFDGEDYTLYIRYSKGNPYIAVKQGMFALGFVLLRDLNERLQDLKIDSKADLETLCSMLEVRK